VISLGSATRDSQGSPSAIAPTSQEKEPKSLAWQSHMTRLATFASQGLRDLHRRNGRVLLMNDVKWAIGHKSVSLNACQRIEKERHG
jgi:hypothetical protein